MAPLEIRPARVPAGTSSPWARSCSGSTRARAGSPPRARSRPGRAAASTTSPAASPAASGCGRRSSRRSRTTPSAGWSRTSSARAGWTGRSSAGCRPTGSAGPCATASTSPSAGSASGPRWACPTAGTRRPRSCGPGTSTGTPSSGPGARAGSTPAASSPACRRRRPAVAREAMEAARRHGAIVSYDLNYRPSLWAAIGGQARAREVNRELVGLVDVLLGNEEDFTAALGFEVEGVDAGLSALDPASFGRMIERVVAAFPNLRVVATTLRQARTATRNDWGAVCWADGILRRGAPTPRSRDPGPRRGRGFVRLGAHLRAARGSRPAGGRRVRRGARGPRDDHARRHIDGHPRRGGAGHARQRRADRAVGEGGGPRGPSPCRPVADGNSGAHARSVARRPNGRIVRRFSRSASRLSRAGAIPCSGPVACHPVRPAVRPFGRPATGRTTGVRVVSRRRHSRTRRYREPRRGPADRGTRRRHRP